jgi:hypothetical protein
MILATNIELPGIKSVRTSVGKASRVKRRHLYPHNFHTL